jgi:ABC-type nickel/cobalt efflux system permease component RcnA
MKSSVMLSYGRMKSVLRLGIILGISLLPLPVFAHPIDEIDGAKVYDQMQTLTVSDKTTLTIDLSIYAIEKNRIWESIDRNRDQVISPGESTNWMGMGSESSYLTDSNGKRIAFIPATLSFPEYLDFFSRPPGKIQIGFTGTTALPEGRYEYHYQGKDKTLSEITIRITGTTGRTVSGLERVDPSTIAFTVGGGLPGPSEQTLGVQTGNRVNTFLERYVKRERLPVHIMFWAIGAAFVLGALHAMTPGHGKAIVASYLIGSRGTAANAVNLALIITITHTASVFLLGIATLILTGYFVPMTVIGILNGISGILVVAFGLVLLVQRIIKQSRSSHPHSHGHEHVHSDIPLTWKNLVPLGISGGIVPCVDALAILVVAATLGKIAFGLGILVAFSVGLATALTGAGIIAVAAKDTISRRWSAVTAYQGYLGIISALTVTLLGVAMLMGIYV